MRAAKYICSQQSLIIRGCTILNAPRRQPTAAAAGRPRRRRRSITVARHCLAC